MDFLELSRDGLVWYRGNSNNGRRGGHSWPPAEERVVELVGE